MLCSDLGRRSGSGMWRRVALAGQWPRPLARWRGGRVLREGALRRRVRLRVGRQ